MDIFCFQHFSPRPLCLETSCPSHRLSVTPFRHTLLSILSLLLSNILMSPNLLSVKKTTCKYSDPRLGSATILDKLLSA